jgi:hypothetical protein
MDTDRDTFLIAVYTQIDTLLQTTLCLPPQPGPPPKMSDTEVLTLLIVGQAHGTSERGLLRWAADTLPAYFPVLLSQSAFNRRARRLGPVCTQLMLQLAELLDAATSPYQVVDTTAVPLARQCRGERHRLFGDEAAVGVGGSDHQYYYGCSVLLAVAADGPVTGLVVGPANTQERWLLDALLTWRQSPLGEPWTVADLTRRSRRGGGGRTGPTGPRWWPDSVGGPGLGLYLADQGFSGRAWRDHWNEEANARVQTVTAADPPGLRRGHHHCRQVIETVNGLLQETFHVSFPKAKTMWGVMCRIIAKCTAVNVGIWANRVLGRADLAMADLFPG